MTNGNVTPRHFLAEVRKMLPSRVDSLMRKFSVVWWNIVWKNFLVGIGQFIFNFKILTDPNSTKPIIGRRIKT